MSGSIRVNLAILKGIEKHTQELIDSVAYKRTHIDKQRKKQAASWTNTSASGNHSKTPRVEVQLLQGKRYMIR